MWKDTTARYAKPNTNFLFSLGMIPYLHIINLPFDDKEHILHKASSIFKYRGSHNFCFSRNQIGSVLLVIPVEEIFFDNCFNINFNPPLTPGKKCHSDAPPASETTCHEVCLPMERDALHLCPQPCGMCQSVQQGT